MSDKTLIVYTSKSGGTKFTALEIEKVFREKHDLDVDLKDLRKNSVDDLSSYNNIIIGSGIRAGRWYKQTLSFLKRDLSGKKLAVYLSSGTALDPNKKEFVRSKYLDEVLKDFPNVKPVAQEVFGWGINPFGVKTKDCGDWDEIRDWANKLVKEFK